MSMLSNILAAKEREGWERGWERGWEQSFERGQALGEKRILLQFVAHVWGDDEAERFARRLDGADRSRFPEITDLMADQAEGRLPRLRQNERKDLDK